MTGDPVWVERGLAAAGLENRAIDYRDTLVGLNALWRALRVRGGCAPGPAMEGFAARER